MRRKKIGAIERKFWEDYKKEASSEDTKRFDELFIVYTDLVDQSKEILVQLCKALCGIPMGVAVRHWLIHTSHVEDQARNFFTLVEPKFFRSIMHKADCSHLVNFRKIIFKDISKFYLPLNR